MSAAVPLRHRLLMPLLSFQPFKESDVCAKCKLEGRAKGLCSREQVSFGHVRGRFLKLVCTVRYPKLLQMRGIKIKKANLSPTNAEIPFVSWYFISGLEKVTSKFEFDL
jgi:hypothetical protein